MLHQNPAVNRLLWLLYAMLAAAAAVLFFRVLFRPLLPLAAAFLLSGLIAKPAEALAKRSRLPLGLWALVLTLLAVALLCCGGWLLVRFAADQAALLLRQLPGILSDLQESLSTLQQRFQSISRMVSPFQKPCRPGNG